MKFDVCDVMFPRGTLYSPASTQLHYSADVHYSPALLLTHTHVVWVVFSRGDLSGTDDSFNVRRLPATSSPSQHTMTSSLTTARIITFNPSQTIPARSPNRCAFAT